MTSRLIAIIAFDLESLGVKLLTKQVHILLSSSLFRPTSKH